MTQVADMPEFMGFLDIISDAQVIYKDEPLYLRIAADKAIEDMVKKSIRYKRKSALTITLEFVPDQLNRLLISAAIGNKEPKPSPLPMTAFTDSRGRLYADDPDQMKIPLEKAIAMNKVK